MWLKAPEKAFHSFIRLCVAVFVNSTYDLRVPNFSFLHPFLSLPPSVSMHTHSFHTNEQLPVLSFCPSPFSCRYIQHTHTASANAAFSKDAHITDRISFLHVAEVKHTHTQKHSCSFSGKQMHTLLQTVPTAALCVSVKSLDATLFLQI